MKKKTLVHFIKKEQRQNITVFNSIQFNSYLFSKKYIYIYKIKLQNTTKILLRI